MMKNYLRNSLYVIGAVIMIAVFVATGNQLFLHAQDESNASYTADATQKEDGLGEENIQETEAEPMQELLVYGEEENSADMIAAPLLFALEFHDNAGNPLSSVTMYVNGDLRSEALDENGRVDIETYDNSIPVEPQAEEGYTFTPNQMIVDMNQPQSVYTFIRTTAMSGDEELQAVYFSFPGKTAEEEEEFLRNDMAIFSHGEVAQIALRGSEYAHLYYGINETIGSMEVERYVPYEGLIEISEREDFEITKVCAYASMDLDTWTEDSKKYCIQVKFIDETMNPADPDDPSNDDQGSTPENKGDLNQPGITYEGSSTQLQTSAGGVNTGDASNITSWITLCMITMGICYMTGKKTRESHL